MVHIRSTSVEISAKKLDLLRSRYPKLVQQVEKRYPLSKGNKYYEPQLQVRRGAVVFCSSCKSALRYRDLRVVTRRIDDTRYEVFFLERCLCRKCLEQQRNAADKGNIQHRYAYHMLYPDEVVEFFRYSLDTVQEIYDWKRDLAKMEHFRSALADQKTPNEILGIEGMCSNIYFSAFSHMLKGDFPFHGRNRRPPKDPVNVILSLAYTFLTREMCAALDAASFESYLGFLHGIRYGRKSLALDMIEPFRQPVVDRLVLFLFGKRIMTQFDFDIEEGEGSREGKVTLNEDGFNKFCREYERWMNGTNSVAGDNFRTRIRDQVSALRQAITEDENFTPYLWNPEQ